MSVNFDFKKHVIRVQGNREYLPVSARLIWFRSEHPDWGIVTTPVEINLTPEGNRSPYAIFQAQIFNAEGRLMATATKMEDARGFSDFIEKAETGSVGRALALCGYGTQFAPELEEGSRLSDSPQPQGGRYGGGYNNRSAASNAGVSRNAPMNGNGTRGPMTRPAPSANRPAPPAESRPEPVEDGFEDEPPLPAAPMPRAEASEPAPPAPSGASAEGNPRRPAPQGKVAPPGAAITRVREPEPENAPEPFEDEDDEDPFLEDDAEPTPASRAARTPAAASAEEGENRCSIEGCPNVLTPAQMTMSQNRYGRPLCPQHQREATPVVASGAGAGSGRRGTVRRGAEESLL
ncbi:MAG: hypothetical protein OHK0029_28770 [Armatimonadaceae bacterium]